MPRGVRIDDVFRLILPSAPALSPDGKQIAFSVKRVDRKNNRYVSHLYLMPAKGGRPRVLTRGLVSDSSPSWSPDGKMLAFVSDRGGLANIWLLPLEGGEPQAITELRGGPAGSISWSPNGKEIAFEHLSMPKETEEDLRKKATFKHITSLYHKEDGIGWFRGESWKIWRASVERGRAVPLTKGKYHDRDPRYSPDGRSIAFVSNRRDDFDTFPDLTSIYVMDRTGKNIREVTPSSGSREAPRWSLDGKHLYWVGYEGGPGEWLNHEHNVWRGPAFSKGAARKLNEGHDRWVVNMVGSDTALGGNTVLAVYEDDGKERVAFGSDEDGSYRVYSIPAAGGKPRLEVGGKLSVLGFSIARGTNQAVYVSTTTSDTGEISHTKLDGSEQSRRLTNLTAPFFKPLRVSTPEEIRFRSGPYDIQGWILKPPGFRAGKKYPCLIEVHGGPMTQYGESWFHEMHLLAAQGYVVAYCNPRGSSGRGMKFCNWIEGAWGKDDWKDIQSFADHLEKQPFIDASRMAILGGSYGGFMVTWAVGHTRRFKTAITMRQAGDFWTHYGSSDYGHYRRFFFDKHPWEDPLLYHQQSPNFYVKNIKTPLLILHQEGDLRCPIAEGEGLFTAMKVLNQAPCEMIRFEGEFHGLSRNGKPLNREERLKRIVDWLERTL